MRGKVSEKLQPFLQQVNIAIAEAKQQQFPFDVATTRQNLDNLAQFQGKRPDISLIKDRVLAIEGREILMRIYNPAPEESLPVMLHFHGGGHMCGSVELYDSISRKVAESCHAIVIFVDYRLAPEHPYPAGIDDCTLALRHYREVIDEMKFTDDILIIGDSAGGAICSTLAMRSLSDPSLRIDKQVLIYPSVDYTMSSDSFSENGHGFLLEKEKIEWYFEEYFQTSAQVREAAEFYKKVSPLHGPITSALPQTLVITAGCDPLRDEGLQYTQALKEAGVAIEHHQFDGMIHAYMLLNNLVIEECEATYQHISKFVRYN